MVDIAEMLGPSKAVDDGSDLVLRWRGRALWSLVALILLGSVFLESAMERTTWDPLAEILFTTVLALGVLAAFAPVTFFRHLYVYAARHGGRRYATTQTLTAAVLAPFLIGIAVVPMLVISDVHKGVAGRRRAHEPDSESAFWETLLWILFGFGTPWVAAYAFGWWGIPGGLLVGIVVARGLLYRLGRRTG